MTECARPRAQQRPLTQSGREHASATITDPVSHSTIGRPWVIP
jgi:hypothetical protein